MGTALIAPITYHLVSSYLSSERDPILFFLYATAVPSLLLSHSNGVYIGVARHFWGYYPVGGPIYPSFLAVFVVGLGGAVIRLGYHYWRKRHALTDFKTLQLKILILAFAVGLTGAVDYVGKFPGVDIYPWGYISAFLFASIMAFGILRAQLLDVQVIIKKTLIFAGLSMFTMIVIAAIPIGFQGTLEKTLGMPRMMSAMLAALVIILAYDPVRSFLVKITDRFLYQSKSNYMQILNAYIEKVSVELNLEKVVQATSLLLQNAIHPKTYTLFLFDRVRNAYLPYANSEMAVIQEDSPIVGYFKEKKIPINLEPSDSLPKEVVRVMEGINSRLAVPLFLSGDLLGFMLLGEKMSDSGYSREEIFVLTDIAKTEAIAIKNARFIEELNVANTELARAQTMKQVADMADGMSHQFNNRFFSISSPLGLLRKRLQKLKETVWEIDDAPAQVRALKELLETAETTWAKVEANAVRGGDLAKGLLRYSRPEKAGFQMHNISDIVNLSIEMLGYKHDDLPALDILRHFSEGVPKTWANASYLQDVFFILLDNSYDAIKQKVELVGDFKGVISIWVEADSLGTSILITIKDNGIGMKPEILEKVRAAIPYVTTKPSSSQKSGYGSGVQVLNRLVDLHGGSVRYDSVYMEGTQVIAKFPVRLPVAK